MHGAVHPNERFETSGQRRRCKQACIKVHSWLQGQFVGLSIEDDLDVLATPKPIMHQHDIRVVLAIIAESAMNSRVFTSALEPLGDFV